AVGLGAQEVDDVGACFEIRNAWERHRRSMRKGLRVCQPEVEMLEGPIALACLRFQRRRIVEALKRCDLAADDSIKIGTDRARGALVEAVTDLAQGDTRFALLRVGL